jgi:hypothetical protein
MSNMIHHSTMNALNAGCRYRRRQSRYQGIARAKNKRAAVPHNAAEVTRNIHQGVNSVRGKTLRRHESLPSS